MGASPWQLRRATRGTAGPGAALISTPVTSRMWCRAGAERPFQGSFTRLVDPLFFGPAHFRGSERRLSRGCSSGTFRRFPTMVFEHIRKLQTEYVDKYVVVDEHRPELQRFCGLTGRVKTVNMNGRALVQFDGRNNIAWFDIDIDYLRVVDAPPPPVEEPAPKRAAAPKKAAEPAAGETSSKPAGATSTAKSSPEKTPAENKPAPSGADVSDVLAAARAKKAAAPPAVKPEPNPDKTE